MRCTAIARKVLEVANVDRAGSRSTVQPLVSA